MSSFYSKIRDLINSIRFQEINPKANLKSSFNAVLSTEILLAQIQQLQETPFQFKRSENGYESSPESNAKSSKKEADINKGYSSNPETSSKRREPTRKTIVSPSLKSRRPSVHTRLDTDKIAEPMPETPLFMPDLSIAIIDSPKKSKVGYTPKGCSETEKAPIIPYDSSEYDLGEHVSRYLQEKKNAKEISLK